MRTTAYIWRDGTAVRRKDSAVKVVPQPWPLSLRPISSRFLFEEERILIADLASKQPVAAKLVGIAGMVAMAQGQMPKLGASSIEPVDVEVVELHREYTFEPAKGRITAVRTTGKVTAADGKITVACNATQQETERRAVPTKDLTAVVEVVEELCAIASSSEPKEARKTRAEALQEKAAKAGFAATAKRLLDSLTRDGLPPGLPR